MLVVAQSDLLVCFDSAVLLEFRLNLLNSVLCTLVSAILTPMTSLNIIEAPSTQ